MEELLEIGEFEKRGEISSPYWVKLATYREARDGTGCLKFCRKGG